MTQFHQLDAFRGDEKLVRIVGHRGARGFMPENTMLGFEWTLEMGVETLEFDVVLTKDLVPVIVHNHQLTRSTAKTADGRFVQGAEPEISQLTYQQICEYDVGGIDHTSEYGQRFPDQVTLDDLKVPRLADLLELVSTPQFSNVGLMLEIKSDPKAQDLEMVRKVTVEKVVEVVRNAGLVDRTILHSFDWKMLAECQLQAPEMPSSFLTQLPSNDDDTSEDSALEFSSNLRDASSVPELVANAGGKLWCPFVKDLNAEDVVRAKQLGLLVVTWTANELSEINQAIDLGVDGIVSDFPGRVQHALLQRGYCWSRTPENLHNPVRENAGSAAV